MISTLASRPRGSCIRVAAAYGYEAGPRPRGSFPGSSVTKQPAAIGYLVFSSDGFSCDGFFGTAWFNLLTSSIIESCPFLISSLLGGEDDSPQPAMRQPNAASDRNSTRFFAIFMDATRFEKGQGERD